MNTEHCNLCHGVMSWDKALSVLTWVRSTFLWIYPERGSVFLHKKTYKLPDRRAVALFAYSRIVVG